MRFTHVSRAILFGVAWMIALGAASSALAQAGSPAVGVTLVARISDAAGVRWNTQPANRFLVSSGLVAPDESSKLDAHFVVLQGTWLFGLGQCVTAESRLEAERAADAQLIALQSPGSPAPQVMSFLPATPAAVKLLDRFNPALGQQTATQGLLVIRESTDSAPEPVLRVRVTAL